MLFATMPVKSGINIRDTAFLKIRNLSDFGS